MRFAIELLGRGNAGIAPHHQRRAAAHELRDDAQCLALGLDVPVDGRVRSDVREINSFREYRFDYRWACIEHGAFDLHRWPQRIREVSARKSGQRLGMSEIGKVADANHAGCGRGRLGWLPAAAGDSKNEEQDSGEASHASDSTVRVQT
jgi:hypothetical protein